MRNPRTIYKCLLILVLFLGLWTCKTNPTSPQITQSVQLSAEYVACTEVWLRLGFADSPAGGEYRIIRNDENILNGSFSSLSTVVRDTTTVANTSYTYTLLKIVDGQTKEIGTQLSVITPDSTNHSWTFRTTTMGGGSGIVSNILFDVAVINDTLAYAVGAIDHSGVGTLDSAGNPIYPYNLEKWDGHSWFPMTLTYSCHLYSPDCGGQTNLYAPASALFAFGPNDIWVAAGAIHHFDGTAWSQEAGIQGAGFANKMWGSSSRDLWFVGYNGFICERTSDGNWEQFSGVTTLNLKDVWGAHDGSALFAAGYDQTGQIGEIFEFDGTNWKSVYSIAPGDPRWGTREVDSLCGVASSIWTMSGRGLWSGTTSGVYHSIFVDGKRYDRISWAPDYRIGFIERLYGEDDNDLFVVGDFNTIAHWNGSTWFDYSSLFDIQTSSSLKSVSVGDNTFIAVGTYSGKAEIIVGSRE